MKRAAFFGGMIALLIAMVCCGKESTNDDTIILLGKESNVISIESMIPDSLQAIVPSLLRGLPEGYIPPDIRGEYVISPKRFCHSNIIDLYDPSDMHLRITSQHNRMATIDFYDNGDFHTEKACVMGNGPRFTLYFKEKKELKEGDLQSSVTRCVIIRGEKTEEGLKNLYFGSIILDSQEGDNPFVGTFQPGWYFIYKDGDGLAENCEWFDKQNGGGI